MKKKTVAVTTIFFTFFGFAWLIESQDRFNRGMIEMEDPTSMNIRPVQYGETEEVEEEMKKLEITKKNKIGKKRKNDNYFLYFIASIF